MTELQKLLDIKQDNQLIQKLELSGYGFAAWRMPNSSESNFIISLNDVERIRDLQLDELNSGYLINTFADNHPVSPYYLPADIIIKGNDVHISPSVKGSALDKLKHSLESAETTSMPETNEDLKAIEHFELKVEAAIEKIKEGQFEKVVLSRFKEEKLPSNFSPWDFFEHISKRYENAFTSLTFLPGHGLWIGASPELLLSDNETAFKTVSLAGTKQLESGTNLSEIAWTQKEIEEQAFVSRYIINCFKKIRLREFHEHGPKTIKAGNLAHLKTEFVVDYNEVRFENLADQMLNLLHPTSAVCGMPIESSKPWIEKIENYNREFYSGFIGPVNFNGSTDLFVNLRCMKVSEGIVRLYAGAGITEDSIPQKEFEETEMKMNVLKANI